MDNVESIIDGNVESVIGDDVGRIDKDDVESNATEAENVNIYHEIP